MASVTRRLRFSNAPDLYNRAAYIGITAGPGWKTWDPETSSASASPSSGSPKPSSK
jgi:hypothetical protein